MKVIIWSKEGCPGCTRAKALLTAKEIAYEERVIGYEWTREQLLEAVPNARTVPQIIIDEQLIGGYENLTNFLGVSNDHNGI